MVSGSGIVIFKTRPSTRPFPGPPEHDLTGRRSSHITVIGYFCGPSTRLGSLWVVGCDCGLYELRRARPIWNHAPGREYRCSTCEKLARMSLVRRFLANVARRACVALEG